MAHMHNLVAAETTDPPRPPARRRSTLPSSCAANIISAEVRRLISPQKTVPRIAKDGSGYIGEVEEWHPTEIDERQAREVEVCLHRLQDALAPPDKGPLLTRILALLSHYRAEANPPQVERLMAEDWAEDLQDYTMEAVDYAARWWRRNKKWRPAICEIRELCEEAMKDDLTALDRMEALLRKHHMKRKARKPDDLRVIVSQSYRPLMSTPGSRT